MTTPIFKIGDTIKVVSRLFEDDGTPIALNTKTIRSVMKKGTQEIVGSNQLPNNFTLINIFQTTEMTPGKYQSDVRFTESGESFSTPAVVIEIIERVS